MPSEYPIAARPRAAEEIAGLPPCPEVAAAAKQRGVTQVVHFTDVQRAVGVLASGFVKSRALLPEEAYLEYVYEPNAQIRKDPAWLDYVNLSIERINDWMFSTSVRWHAAEGNPWVVLSFDPQILAHPGVVFTTTNNIYRDCLRSERLPGFSQMFASSVVGWEPWERRKIQHNRVGKSSAWPTDRQAEVLYPGELSCDFLQRIDVQTENGFDTVCGVLGGLNLSVPVRYAPEAFQ